MTLEPNEQAIDRGPTAVRAHPRRTSAAARATTQGTRELRCRAARGGGEGAGRALWPLRHHRRAAASQRRRAGINRKILRLERAVFGGGGSA